MKKWARANSQPSLPLGEDGRLATASRKHIEISKNAAKEGMVLLKNEESVLPLRKGAKVALFGKGIIDYVKGGGGSAEVCVPYIRSIADGFAYLAEHTPDAPYIFEDSVRFYKKHVNHQYALGALPGMAVEPELPDELIIKAAAFTDTAVIAISRFSGEGWDRRSEYDDNRQLKGIEDQRLVDMAAKVFPKGDFYLTDEEQAMVRKVTSAFAKVVVVLNVGGVMDTSWFAHNEHIQSVLMAWQAGIEGGLAAAELLCGMGNPSGKLADTFAATLGDYPCADTFHDSHVHVDYFEDIYVGYRYFETIPGASEKVVYPFGYGLSYTQFEISDISAVYNEKDVTVSATVCNIGKIPGKEVLQLYVSAPQGLLGKAARTLCAYQKTRLLSVGEVQRITMTAPFSAFASYDDLGKICEAAWIMEKGSYQFFLGNSVRNVNKVPGSLELAENIVLEQLSHKLVPQALEKRMLSDGTFERLPMTEGADVVQISEELRNLTVEQETVFPRQTIDEMYPKAPPVRGQEEVILSQDKKEPQLIDVAEGKISLDDFISKLSDEDLAWMMGGQPNTGVGVTFGYGNNQKYGVPNIMTADGPAGLRVYEETGVKTTAFPCATLLACTFDPDVTEEVGQAAALEVKENNIDVWLAPGVCIHRNPLCGRNFEYYSEDPYLAGKQAAGMVTGTQSRHIAATVKHFAFNNKETNRRNADARVSERAAREIYLKAFEMIVKEAHPWSIMSSYNLVNGQRCSESHDLLTAILRDEWGFDGMVTTDWWGFGEHYLECKAGNDIKLGRGFAERLLAAKDAGVLTRSEMETSVKNILTLILRVD